MGIQRSSALDLYKTSRKLMIQLEGRSCIIFALSLVPPMKLVRLIKLCLTETYSRAWVGKNLSDVFPIRNGLKKEMLYRHCFSTLPYGTPLGGFR